MDKKKINTIEMTRRIRDEHAKQLAGKSHAERITFYREQAKKMEKKIPALLKEIEKS
jgi:nucleosome binding factor SPN SPT16 subunit